MAQLILHPHAGGLFDADSQLAVTRALGTLGARFSLTRVPEGLIAPPRVCDLEREAGGGFIVVAIRPRRAR